jgi:hypothetical protein
MAHATVEVTEQPIGSPVVAENVLAGYMAEFDTVEGVVTAAEKVRDAGYQRWDVHSPFPIHGIDGAMGIKPTILPWIVLGMGLTGLAAGIGLELFTNSFQHNDVLPGYPFLISGKPLVSFPAFVPVFFETTVLLSAFGAVFGMLGLNKLPMLYNPLFNSERFRRVTDDRFFIVIDSADPKFDPDATMDLMESLKPLSIERVED